VRLPKITGVMTRESVSAASMLMASKALGKENTRNTLRE
jgi:hypothetical protein